MAYGDILITKLDDYDIKVGDKVYILTSPKSGTDGYTFKEATIIRIAKNTHVMEKPNINTKHYKAKLKMWENYQNRDECDRCTFTINVNNQFYNREVSRKYLYTLNEFEILKEDLENLNKVYDFKKQQQLEFEKFVEDNFKTWNYYCFENRRKINKKGGI